MSLLKEVKNNKTEKVLELLQGQQDLNQTDAKNGNSLLHLAIENENLAIIKALVNRDSKVDFNLTNKDGVTALHLAVNLNFYDAVEALLKAGADPNFASSDGQTALHYAASNNFKDIARLLLKSGAQINHKSSQGTPLHFATANSNDEVAFLFFENKRLNFSEVDGDGNTFLHTAVENGATNIFQKFFADYDEGLFNDHKEHVLNMAELMNHANNEGNTVLHQAELSRKTAISQYLRNNAAKYGLNVNFKNKAGFTADQCLEGLRKKIAEEEELKKRERENIAEGRKLRKEEREQHAEELRKQEALARKKAEEEIEAAKAAHKTQQKFSKLYFFGFLVGAFLLMYVLFSKKIEEKKENILDL